MKREYIIVCFVLGILCLLPNMLFTFEDKQREKATIPVQKQQLISMDAENMYLVNQLHFLDYQGMNYLNDTKIQAERYEALSKEVKKMKEFGLIKDSIWNIFETIREEKEYKTYTFNRVYSYEESYTTLNNEIFAGNILMEAKTNKIIKFYLLSDEALVNDEVTMKKYIQYLGLDAVDDWKLVKSENYQDDYMVSEKSQLKVYTSTDRIVMYKENGYQTMYRVLFSVETITNDEQFSVLSE